MPGNALNSLIETLVHAIEMDAAALRRRYVLRQALQGLVCQDQAEQLARIRREGSGLAGGEGARRGQQGPQQASCQQG